MFGQTKIVVAVRFVLDEPEKVETETEKQSGWQWDLLDSATWVLTVVRRMGSGKNLHTSV